MALHIEQLFSNPKQNWLSACQELEQHGDAYCIATVVAEAGSLPRGTGSKMVISLTHQFDTLGGGQLELEVVNTARRQLADVSSLGTTSNVQIERFSLAADLGQCCGGAVQIMFEYRNVQLPKVVVFGAGHVCHALVKIMSELPCHLLVIDTKQEWLDSLQQQGISTLLLEEADNTDPLEDIMATISPASHLVIMTHDHSLDYKVTKHALQRGCFPFVGLIGSASKKQRFEFRLKDDLSAHRLLEQLTCPIGNPDIRGKLPMQVAVSISAQLMACFEEQATGANKDKQSNAARWDQVNQLRRMKEKINKEAP